MDLSPGQQKAVFVLVVVVLAALGYWLILPKVTHSSAQAAAQGTQGTQGTQGAQATQGSTQAANTPATTQVPVPAVTASPATAGNVNIYSWLPFTQQGLATAAAVTVKFSVDYNTYTYTESAAAYVAKMGGLITGQLATVLKASYETAGVAQLRTGQKQVSTGTAAISSLRAFGPSSLTFVVTTGQRLVTSSGTTNGSTQWAVTVTGSGSSWQVDDIEPASAGNS